MKKHQTTLPTPTAQCKIYAALLPILDEPGIDSDAAAEARAHLATCAYCQQQQAAYRQLATAASRYLSPPVSRPGVFQPGANRRAMLVIMSV